MSPDQTYSVVVAYAAPLRKRSPFSGIDVDQPALDNGDAHARSRETSRQKRPGLSDADDNRIECDHSSLHGQRVRWDAPLDRRGKIINKMYLMSSGL